jgi:hypothetical protein
MKIYVQTTGDWSVGIPGQDAVVDMDVSEMDTNDRAVITEQLKRAFGQIWGEKCDVRFEDELDGSDGEDADVPSVF